MSELKINNEIDSIADLYKEFSGLVFRYLLKATGSREIAEELTQETFFQALLSINKFNGEAKVSTWLYKVTRNVYLSHLRKKTRIKALEEKLIQPINKSETSGLDQPEKIFEQKLQQEKIQRVLKMLPEQYSTIIILKEIEGLSHNEIAEIFEKSVPSTKVMLYRQNKDFRRNTKDGIWINERL